VKKTSLSRPEVAAFRRYYLKHAELLVTEVGYVPVSLEQQQRNTELLQQALSEISSKQTPSSASAAEQAPPKT
jgi:hypothetical protein